jgi:hypothetical protein
MRVLLVDNTELGHHPIYFQIILEELLVIGFDVVYAYPRKLPGNAEHIAYKQNLADRLALRLQRLLDIPVASWLNWRRLERLQRKARAERILLIYLDRYLFNGYVHRASTPWSGLYFHPRSLRLGPESSGPWAQLR